jgi:hypothetical protein
MTRGWTIRIEYTTGDSNGSYDTSDDIELTWSELDNAKAALARIREFNDAENHNQEAELGWSRKKPIDLTKLAAYSSEYPEVTINLKLDDGSEQRIHAFWRGYFENLRKAEIVPVDEQDNDMVYEPERS